MKQFTKSMNHCLDEIKEEVKQLHKSSIIGFTKIIIKKPTKKKRFIAKFVNIGIPAFSLSINSKNHSTFILRKDKWVIEKG